MGSRENKESHGVVLRSFRNTLERSNSRCHHEMIKLKDSRYHRAIFWNVFHNLEPSEALWSLFTEPRTHDAAPGITAIAQKAPIAVHLPPTICDAEVRRGSLLLKSTIATSPTFPVLCDIVFFTAPLTLCVKFRELLPTVQL